MNITYRKNCLWQIYFRLFLIDRIISLLFLLGGFISLLLGFRGLCRSILHDSFLFSRGRRWICLLVICLFIACGSVSCSLLFEVGIVLRGWVHWRDFNFSRRLIFIWGLNLCFGSCFKKYYSTDFNVFLKQYDFVIASINAFNLIGNSIVFSHDAVNCVLSDAVN